MNIYYCDVQDLIFYSVIQLIVHNLFNNVIIIKVTKN